MAGPQNSDKTWHIYTVCVPGVVCICVLKVMNVIVFMSVLPSFSAFFHHSDYHQGLLPLSLNHSPQAVSLPLVLYRSPLMNCWAELTPDPQLTLLSSWQIVIYICTVHTDTHTYLHILFLPLRHTTVFPETLTYDKRKFNRVVIIQSEFKNIRPKI